MKYKIGILGQGYVGKAISEAFSKHFQHLNTYDKYISKYSSVNSLEELTKKSEIIFICLPTPMKNNGECFTGIVEEEIQKINQISNASDEKIVVIKSTVPPGTSSNIGKKNTNINVIFNPEFLTEKNYIEDFQNQEKVIIGGYDKNNKLEKLYKHVFPNIRVLKCSQEEAEMVKYIINTFLAMKVSYANELKILCDKLKINYDTVSEIAQFDKRVGYSHWKVPGPDGKMGFGGSCFPKDINALIYIAKQNNIKLDLLTEAWELNLKVRPEEDWKKLVGRSVLDTKKI